MTETSSTLTLGKYSFIGKNFYCRSDVKIGKYTSISWNVSIAPGQHPTNFLSTHPFQYKQNPDLYRFPIEEENLVDFNIKCPVEIGNDVWIGCNTVIMDGVKIADGAIIAAGAVVTRDVPPYAIAAGVPAKIIRYRFKPEVIAKLLELKWWDMPEEKISKLPFNDINKCIEELEKMA